MSTEAIAVLVRAREFVREGWVQGTGYVTDNDGNTRRCAGQAIQDAFYAVHGQAVHGCMCGGCPSPEGGETFNNVMREFQWTIQYDSIPHWNDVCGRTQAEVVEAFDKTIKRMSAPKVVVPKVTVVPERIEATWKPVTITMPKVIPVEVVEDEPVGIVKKVLASIGV